MADAAYKVKLDVFEGPLDLLLYLVRKDEVDIYDIAIERITRQYLEYLEQMESIDVEIGGEFIVMAANLLYIKSRTLLPVDLQGPVDEEGEDEDVGTSMPRADAGRNDEGLAPAVSNTSWRGPCASGPNDEDLA